MAAGAADIEAETAVVNAGATNVEAGAAAAAEAKAVVA
jgi:hypothetical protein